MAHLDFRVISKLGPWGALKTLYKMRTMKVGKLVGTDVFGNQYFENREEYANGQHRWVVYAGDKSFYEVDASYVAPEWHSWLHHVTNDPPTDTTVGSTHARAPESLAAGSSNPYERNLGGVISPPSPNPSQVRPRAWGMGNNLGPAGSAPNVEGAYTQPGFPTDPRNKKTRRNLGFSLKDTPFTLEAKNAARVGLPLEKYARYIDTDSPTNLMLRLGMGSEEVSELSRDPSLAPEQVMFLEEAAEGIPHSPEEKSLAVHLAVTGSPPTTSTAFTEALQAALTPLELSLYRPNGEESKLAEARKYQKMIDGYKDIRDKSAQAGVKLAIEKRDKLLEEVGRIFIAELSLHTTQSASTLTHAYTHTFYSCSSSSGSSLPCG